MITAEAVSMLLSMGESQTVEFKSSFDREAIEALVAFCQHSRGTILR